MGEREKETHITKDMGKLIGRGCDNCYKDKKFLWKAQMYQTNIGRVICNSCKQILGLEVKN
jgi:hypothetical protein